MIINEIIKWLILLAGLYQVYNFWRKLHEQWEEEKEQALGGSSSGNTDGNLATPDGLEGEPEVEPSQSQPSTTPQRKEQTDPRSDFLKKILENDPTLADEIRKLVGIEDQVDLLTDPDLVKKIAEQLSNRALHILDVVAKNPILDLDLETKSRLQETDAGGIYQEPRAIRNLSEINRLKQSEWALPNDVRMIRILTGQAQRLQRYDIIQDKKILSVLEDASGSMIKRKLYGIPRYYWSRGTIVNLARQAIKGNTEFVYRQFNEHALAPIHVKTQSEAQEFFNWSVNVSPATGGTNIYNALSEAVKNVVDGEVLELLLITDGEDKSIHDVRKVKRLLSKGDIRLHVIVIGGDNRDLEKVATTYQTVT